MYPFYYLKRLIDATTTSAAEMGHWKGAVVKCGIHLCRISDDLYTVVEHLTSGHVLR
jgi:hypothetical protein